ncbi:MAG TPA: gametolysin [Candidatus Limosilactobacillus intestinipullorum]|nr:gametolysin [Candidatus Limosilactobacillus intestinipullorum]
MTNYGYVLDVSAFQPQAAYYNFWDKWKARGVKGGIVKLSEGTGWTNGYGAGQIAAIKHEGLMASGYHFSRFRGNTYQAVSEANLAITCARRMGLPQGAPLVLDYEERLGYRASNTQAAIAFLKCIKAAGYVPVFYSYSGMANLWDFEAIHSATGAMLWIAAYSTLAGVTSPNMGYFPGISNFIGAWQFTDNMWGEHIDGSIDLTGVFTSMAEQKVTSGGHLDGYTFNEDKLTVSGWFASDKAQGKPFSYIILTDDTGHEYARAAVALANRSDVAKVYPDIPNGGKSGFSASFDYTPDMAGKKLHVIFRYTDDKAGNGNFLDYTQEIMLNQSAAYLDSKSVTVDTNDLFVSGWFASDLSAGLKYHYLILYDTAAKQELQRLKVEPVERKDVADHYKSIYGADKSGFTGDFKYNGNLVGRKLQIVARYSDDPKYGEGKKVDFWFDPFDGPAMPMLTGDTSITVRCHDFTAKKYDDGMIEVTMK